jgi:hypothetical protein
MLLLTIFRPAGRVGASPGDGIATATPDPSVLSPQGDYQTPVTEGQYTIYVNAEGVAITGALPDDAARGFAPTASGVSAGPDTTLADCDKPPDQNVTDHATFTDQQLLDYGLPSHDDIPDIDEWTATVRALNTRLCATHNEYHNGKPLGHSGQSDGQSCERDGTPPDNFMTCPSAQGAGAWAGYAADRYHEGTTGDQTAPYHTGFPYSNCDTLGTCYAINEVVGFFHVPYVYNNGNPDTVASEWIGIGGQHLPSGFDYCNGTIGSLVQAGVESDRVSGTTVYTPWIENLSTYSGGCKTEQAVTSMTVQANDEIEVYIGSSDVNYESRTTINDISAGEYYTCSYGGSICSGNWPHPDWNSAECILEWSHYGSHMTDVSDVHFEHCRYWKNWDSTIHGLGEYDSSHRPDNVFYKRDTSPYPICASPDAWDTGTTPSFSSYWVEENNGSTFDTYC